MATPQFTLSEMLEAGVHFGHRTHRWNPLMREYIYGARNGIHIMDLRQTVPMTYSALTAIQQSVAKGGRVLFVGTKRQAQDVVAEAAERCGQFYINHRWLGGTLTNWKTINNSINRLKQLENMFAEAAAEDAKIEELQAKGEDVDPSLLERKSAYALRTKKEKLMMQREYAKLNRVLGGIKNMGGLPDVVIVMDVNRDRIAIDEANVLGIPVVGILDSNANPDGVTYRIPGNDDSTRAIRLYNRLFSDAVLAGMEQQAQKSSSPMMTRNVNPEGRETKVKLSKAAEAAAAAEEAAVEAPAEEKKAAPKKAAPKAEEKAAAAS